MKLSPKNRMRSDCDGLISTKKIRHRPCCKLAMKVVMPHCYQVDPSYVSLICYLDIGSMVFLCKGEGRHAIKYTPVYNSQLPKSHFKKEVGYSSIASEGAVSSALVSVHNCAHFGKTRLYNDIHTVSIWLTGPSK